MQGFPGPMGVIVKIWPKGAAEDDFLLTLNVRTMARPRWSHKDYRHEYRRLLQAHGDRHPTPRRQNSRRISNAQGSTLLPTLGDGEHDRHDRHRGHEHVEHQSDDGSLSNSKVVLASLEGNDAF